MEVIKEREEALIRAARDKERIKLKIKFAKDLIAFGRFCVPKMCTKPSPPFHYHLSNEYLTDLDRQLISLVAPRGHGKSSLVAGTFVLWHVFLEDLYRYLVGLSHTPERKTKLVGLISKTQGEAKKRLGTIKAIIGDENGDYEESFRALFGNHGYGTHRKWSTTETILGDGTMFIAIGTGQQARGLKQVHQRPTLIIVDDPEDEKNTITTESMENNKSWLLQSIVPSMDADVGRTVVIGTPINQTCMIVSLYGATGWTSAWYGNDLATERSTYNKDDYEHDRLLWPELMGKKQLQAKLDMFRDMGKLGGYYREYETKVVGDEDQLFKPQYFRHFEGELKKDLADNHYLEITHDSKQGGALVELADPRKVPVFISMGVDPAVSTSKRADYTVILLLATDENDNCYVIDYIRRKMPPPVILDTVRNTHEIYSPKIGRVETVAAQKYITTMLRKEGIFLQDSDPRKGKEERLAHLVVPFFRGKMFMKESQTELKNELMAYPRSQYDDTMDGLDNAYGCRMRPHHSIVENSFDVEKYKERRTFDPMLA